MTRVTKSQEAFDTLVKVHIATAELAKKQKELENLKEMVLKTDLEIENLKAEVRTSKISVVKGLINEDWNENTAKKQADSDNTNTTFFVGWLNPATDKASLRAYFSRYGDVNYIFINQYGDNSVNNRYGFVGFSKVYGEHPIKQSGHVIDGTAVRLNRDDRKSYRILIIGKVQDLTEAHLRSEFSKYGRVTRVEKIRDDGCYYANRAMITFDTREAAEAALDSHPGKIGSLSVHIKKIK